MPNPTLDELYEKALRALLTRIVEAEEREAPEGVRDLCIALINLEQARMHSRPVMTVEELLESVHQDPTELN